MKGSTHDAIAYQPTVLVSRLEGPVTYPPKVDLSGLHSGSRHASIRNPDPDAPPEVNVTVDALPYESTGVFGVRQLLCRLRRWHVCGSQLAVRRHLAGLGRGA